MRIALIRLSPALAALAFLAAGRPALRAGDYGLHRFDIVQVAPITTTLYLANISLSVPHFVRRGGEFEATYKADIVPYFFWDEHGTMRIEVGDDALRRFALGQGFHFTGRAVSSEGESRRVDGQVTPTGPADGRIEVRVYVTRHISMAFRTTYHLPGVSTQRAR